MREEHRVIFYMNCNYGITPACAGRTYGFLLIFVLRQDHPRVCGKNAHGFVHNFTLSGSPPRVREELYVPVLGVLQRGITPACAGRTPYALFPFDKLQDHPRVCGKNPKELAFPFLVVGSPPRVREELANRLSVNKSVGITPACAGRTLMMTVNMTIGRDHPRVCGKNPNTLFTPKAILGSPPRVREELY